MPNTNCPVYEICIVQMPSDEEVKKGVAPKLLMEPKCFLASSAENAMLVCAKQNPNVLPDNMENVRVFVRPFVA